MGIDWFTFFAQIVNFLILVWLLKKFLYRPVLAAMAKREERIAARLEEARAKAEASEEEKQRYVAMQDELQSRIAREMQQAKADAEKFRQDLLGAAREETSAKREAWLSALRKEEVSFLAETSHSITGYFQELSRNALRELAQEDLDERIVTVFLSKLESHDRDAIEELSAHISGATEPLVVTTAFSLSESQQARIIERLAAIVGPAHHYEFEVDSDLLAGITVEVDGKKIHWDIGEYLKKFEKRLAGFLASHPAMGRGQ